MLQATAHRLHERLSIISNIISLFGYTSTFQLNTKGTAVNTIDLILYTMRVDFSEHHNY